MKKLIVVMSAACLSGQVLAQASNPVNKQAKRIDFESFFESPNEETNTYVSLMINRNGNKINDDSEVRIVSPGIEVMREFFENQYISLGLMGRAALKRGSEDFVDQNNLRSEDEYKGYEYGGGLSLNLNTEGFGMRVQPFYAANFMKSNSEKNIKYNRSSTTLPSEVNYNLDSTRIVHSLGVRFIDKKVGISSFLSFDYNQMLEKEEQLSAVINQSAANSVTMPGVNYDNVTATLGFGIAF